MVNIQRLQRTLNQKNLKGFIVTNPVNIFYLSGFRGLAPYDTEREAILAVTGKKTVLLTAKLYRHEAQKLASKTLEIIITNERNELQTGLKKVFSKLKKIGFEEQNLKFSEYKELKKSLPGSLLVPVKDLVEEIRIEKSADEIAKVEKAQKISQKAFGRLVKTVKTGQREAEIAEKLEKIMRSLGAQGTAFPTIVAAGKNSALPHYHTGRKKIKFGEVLLLDFGARYKNYCADITRTIFIGKPKPEQLNIYNHVKKAQEKAIKAIKHKIAATEAFSAAHTHFKNHRLHDYFIHGLGHGIGLEVHEKPHLRAKSDDVLTEGMVFSVEPGLYFPKWGGIRIEDLVTIKNGKAKVLDSLQKEIIII